MSAVVCPNCSMQFTSPGLLYKHQSKFCVGGPIDPRRDRDYEYKQADRSKPHFYTGPQFYGQSQDRHSPAESARSFQSNSSMSIHLPPSPDERESPNRRHYDQDLKMRKLQMDAESYGRNLEGLHSRQQLLEQQKHDIERRLNRLGHQEMYPGPDPQLTQTENRILTELQRQEDRNRKQLAALRKQLQGMQAGRTAKKMLNLMDDLFENETAKNTQRDFVPNGSSSELNEIAVGNTDENCIPKRNSTSEHQSNTDDVREGRSGLCAEGARGTFNQLDECAGTSKISVPSSKISVPSVVSSAEVGTDDGEFLKDKSDTVVEERVDDNVKREELTRICCFCGRPNTVNAGLLPEIIAMRQAYLRQGGANPGILAQMADLEAEARAVQDSKYKPSKRRSDKGKVEELTERIHAFELENQRLQNELLVMQERNNERIRDVRDKQHAEDMESFEREARARQKEHLQKLAELEQEMEVARQEARLERMRRELEQEKQAIPVPLPRQPAPLAYHADVPYLMNGQQADVDSDPLNPSPYDQTSGFVIFYDFVVGLELSTQFVRLVTCLYNNEAQYGEPTVLPSVQTVPASQTYFVHGSQTGLISARQPVPRCPAMKDMSVIIELQTAAGTPGYPTQSRLTTKAWAKLDLFDIHGRLISGRWRLPVRMTPIKPALSTSDLNTVPQYGAVELCVRLVNHRDADAQTTSRINPANIDRYFAQPQGINIPTPMSPGKQSPHHFMSQSASARGHAPRSPPISKSRKRLEDYNYDQESYTIGFQVDRVKNAQAGEGKVRLTAYHKKSGKIVQSETGPVTCSTTAVRSNFKHGYHVFGQQEATFHDVDVKSDMILLVRFYLRKLLEADDSASDGGKVQESQLDSETLVGWGSLPLMVDRHGVERVRVGTHVIRLYQPPVPDTDSLPASEHYRPKEWKRYTSASARVHVFQGRPRAESISPSEESDQEDDDIMPEGAWIPHERSRPPKASFSATDGIDFYIDGARFLPDNVTITRVAGRLLSRRYEKAGKDINAMIDVDSDIYNPVYNTKVEFREPNIPPTATVLLKIYTIDKFYKTLTVVGYATLNLFVAIGTENQPKLDSGGVQISLNTGCHQLPLYAQGPNGVDPLGATTMKDARVRRIPCASLLVRLYQAPMGSNGRPLELDQVPQYDWARLGLWLPIPRYRDRCYYSMSCKPTRGECKMFQAHVRRRALSVRDALRMIQEPNEVLNITSDKQLAARVQSTMSKTLDAEPMDMDLNLIVAYDPKYGIKAALDSAMNLPWTNLTHATLCLNPPGAFYMGQPLAAYDKLKFTRELQLKSTTKSPEWKDGYFHFPHRAYHKYLTLVIHLQEVSVTFNRDTYKYGLLDQAWTAVQIFNEGYVNTQMFQLPLFYGPPKAHLLRSLAKEPPRQWIMKNVINKSLKPVENASVFVRIADGRREAELPPEVRSEQLVKLNVDYIPPSQMDKYAKELPGKDLMALVPPGKSPEQFKEQLATKFKSLVYKQYEEGVARRS